MSKRGSEDTSLDFVLNKIRKLEKEVKRSRRERRNGFSLSSSSSSSTSSSSSRAPSPNQDETINHQETLVDEPPTSVTEVVEVITPDESENIDIQDILGVDPTVTLEYGPEIHKDVASRFAHIATTGLDKDTRKELSNKYLIPENCTSIAAPQLNPEIKGVLFDQVIKRDKAIEGRQKLMAVGITALGKIISTQLSSKDKNNDLIKELMDIGRIFCDIQHSDSECRRNFALYSVKKELKEQLSTTKIDKFLFGSNLLEKVKTAKAITKSSSDLKPDAPKKPKSNPTPSTSGKPLNWKTRTPARRQPPGPRSRHQQPAAQSAPARGNSSQSYTQRPKPSRRH
ncbi:uncharacterized protein LOC123693215 [Colias croceus]|uniref:uncharacterized protein LOC123693215 n=1 Tax=Colias crocea TaxID=72248 RepID=UPI001E27F6CB|nr:uncharacterized protein LOC123693215 [Colias croceus]